MDLLSKSTYAAMALACVASSCVDNNYDLSDIDTTVQVNVNNLTIPVNIDVIKMKSILDPSDDSPIKIIDGAYTYVNDGTFSSKDIKVDAISVNSLSIPSSNFSIDNAAWGAFMPNTFDIQMGLGEMYIFQAKDISPDIHGLDYVSGSFTFTAIIKLDALKDRYASVAIKNLKLQIPKNLKIKSCNYAYDYDESNGYLTLLEDPTANPLDNLKIEIELEGLKLGKEAFSYADHTLNVKGTLNILSGTMDFEKKPDATAEALSKFALGIDYKLTDFVVNGVSGQFEYHISNLIVPDINIDDLPDVLSQAGTNISLANPRLYLHVTNPLQSCNVYAQTDLTLTSMRDGKVDGVYSVDQPIVMGRDVAHANGEYNFCLSPQAPTTGDAEYPDAQYVPFTTLGNVLSGDGVPSTIKVDLGDTQIPLQDVDNFQLGVTYPGVDGTYKIAAPLNLAAGSAICYTDKLDGWSSETLDDMTITALDVNVTVTTDIPVGVDFKGYPIDKAGNRINNVSIEGAKINANANQQAVTLHITGAIKGLDGIEFTAVATAADGRALSPDMTIKLENVRPQASGYLQKEL